MAQRLESKVAIVSGAARGQGAAHAELMAAEGASVLIGDIRDDEGEALAADLTSRNGIDVRYVHLDVTRRESWDAAVNAATSAWGHVDVLVNNAGISGFAGASDCSDDEWDRIIAVNQTGVFFGMRAVLGAMLEQQSGSIVNISSIFGLCGAAGALAYQASKGAVISMTKSAALSYGEAGVRANAICPGTIETPMLKAEIEEIGKAEIDALVELQTIKRYGRPEEISNAVIFLASDESSFVTGAVLAVDGGYSAG
jgi:NAD(P)-dependent dehydrogenase (short-subunit alcohol dehydrogenase family)